MGWDKMDISLLTHVPQRTATCLRARGFFLRLFSLSLWCECFYVFFEWMPQRRPRYYFHQFVLLQGRYQYGYLK